MKLKRFLLAVFWVIFINIGFSLFASVDIIALKILGGLMGPFTVGVFIGLYFSRDDS